jgi:OPT family oligopeptide transporter
MSASPAVPAAPAAPEPSPPARERTPDEIERAWLANVYAGDDVRQLTVRAVVTGMLLGGLMALSNLYVSLKTGWSLGVTITAAVLGFGFWSVVGLAHRRMRPFGPLENNAMQSVASAAGYMTGGGTVAAIPALMLVTGYRFEHVTMMIWIGALAFLGVFVAIPLKRQLINVEELRFPSGVAAAETVKSLHASGDEARRKARALGFAGLAGAALAFARDALKLFPEHLAVFGAAAAKYTIQAEGSLVMVGAGALMGLRVTLSQLGGALLCYGVLAPWARSQGAIAGPVAYKTIIGWSVWIGAPMMLTAGLLQFFLQWRSIARAVGDAASLFRPRRRLGPYRSGAPEAAPDDPLARVEVPASWFLAGLAVLGPIVIGLERALFGIPVWMGALTVLLSLLVGIVAARTTGETDTTPGSALGKLVQIVFGVLHPGNMTTNLMAAQASAGVAIHASDLLTDLKSGHLLGAKPRHQFFAQFFGVVAGTAVVVPAYMLLIPDASHIGDKYPAPAAQAWAAIARLLSQGLGTLHPTARWGLVLGGLAGIALVACERLFPKHKRFVPSAMGVGLAFTFPAWNSVSMAAGALTAWALEKKRPLLAAAFVVPAASGLIAGESLVGVLVGLVEARRGG